jgi:putative endonuclease
MPERRRRQAFLFGHDAEFWAEILLRLKGYRIRERRFLAGGGEIDLIVSRGSALVFVEVKARADLDSALLTITPAKIARIARAARAYLGRLDRLPETIRCDAVLIAPDRLPRHIENIAELPMG